MQVLFCLWWEWRLRTAFLLCKNLVRSLLQSRCQLASIRLGAKLTLVRIQSLRLTYLWNWESLLKNKVLLTPKRCPFFVVKVSSSDRFSFLKRKSGSLFCHTSRSLLASGDEGKSLGSAENPAFKVDVPTGLKTHAIDF